MGGVVRRVTLTFHPPLTRPLNRYPMKELIVYPVLLEQKPVLRGSAWMAVLTFVSALVNALARPAVTITVVILFRDAFRALLTRVRSAEGAGFKSEFEDELKQADKKADEADLPPAPALDTGAYDRPPSTRVFEAWRQLETLLYDVFTSRKGEAPQTYTELLNFF